MHIPIVAVADVPKSRSHFPYFLLGFFFADECHSNCMESYFHSKNIANSHFTPSEPSLFHWETPVPFFFPREIKKKTFTIYLACYFLATHHSRCQHLVYRSCRLIKWINCILNPMPSKRCPK